MKIKIRVFFEVDVWNNRFLISENKVPWTKAVITNQGLDRIGDSYWASGVHIGSGSSDFSESSTGLTSPILYKNSTRLDNTASQQVGDEILWTRNLEYVFDKSELKDSVSELSLSWDEDPKTSTANVKLPQAISLNDDESLVVKCRIDVIEDVNDVHSGTIDFGASLHNYTIKPCFYGRFKDVYIGSPISQKDGRVYSGVIPTDLASEPEGSIDTNLGLFDEYTFDTHSKTFVNFFTLSSPNAVTRTVTSHTFGLPSAFGVEFDPPIDKDFNRELTLNFRINWERG